VSVAVRELRTDRLLLRQWREADFVPFAELNADPEVMRYFPASLTRVESDNLAHTISSHLDDRGWGLWAVEVVDGRAFIGFVGLSVPNFDAHFVPAVEVGWRLGRQHWGRGYASEAARAAVDFGFRDLELDEVVAMIVPANTRSRQVAERLGMTRDPADDFDHPDVPEGPLRRHLLYRTASSID
jgi:RimJ/RimL family protein N-acetyltransferase